MQNATERNVCPEGIRIIDPHRNGPRVPLAKVFFNFLNVVIDQTVR